MEVPWIAETVLVDEIMFISTARLELTFGAAIDDCVAVMSITSLWLLEPPESTEVSWIAKVVLAILLTSVERSFVVLLKLVAPLITVIKGGMRVLEGATVEVEVRVGPMMIEQKHWML